MKKPVIMVAVVLLLFALSFENEAQQTRLSLGNISFSNSNLLPLSSVKYLLTPVIFPPGFARLVAKPVATASPTDTNMIGIVVVNSLTARVAASDCVIMMSCLSRSRSAARAGI